MVVCTIYQVHLYFKRVAWVSLPWIATRLLLVYFYYTYGSCVSRLGEAGNGLAYKRAY